MYQTLQIPSSTELIRVKIGDFSCTEGISPKFQLSDFKRLGNQTFLSHTFNDNITKTVIFCIKPLKGAKKKVIKIALDGFWDVKGNSFMNNERVLLVMNNIIIKGNEVIPSTYRFYEIADDGFFEISNCVFDGVGDVNDIRELTTQTGDKIEVILLLSITPKGHIVERGITPDLSKVYEVKRDSNGVPILTQNNSNQTSFDF